VNAAIFAMAVACSLFLDQSLLVIATALVSDTHFQDWEWNSILNVQAVSMAVNVAAIDVGVTSWLNWVKLNGADLVRNLAIFIECSLSQFTFAQLLSDIVVSFRLLLLEVFLQEMDFICWIV
jgi:hypothetical protein